MTRWTPPVSFDFGAPRPQCGPGLRSISLSGLKLQLDGLDAETDAFVAHRFRRYLVGPESGSADLHLTFRREAAGPYINPQATVGSARAGATGAGVEDVTLQYQMQHALRNGVLYYASGSTGARVEVARGSGIVLQRLREGALLRQDPVHLATENLLRSALAWTVLLRGGFMLHSASVVRDGRCYLFFGNSGAGKSTIASICGGQVISDDLTMVLPHGEGFAAIGSPFRGTYTACDDLTDRYPVAGIFRLRKDVQVSVKPISGAAAFSEFLANLPFVVSEIDHYPGAWDRARAAFKKLKAFELHFRKDDSFWRALEDLHIGT